MKKQPLQPAHNGAFLVNATAAADPAVQMAMASYLERLQREEAHRQAIRNGTAQQVQSTTWHISDRH
ncbi:MAG: hypothetical protein ACO3CH_09185 [Ilumatobacteraceae bacterium]|jgi:hypothetical protein